MRHILLAAVLSLTAAAAEAALVPVDSGFGPATLIRDTDSGLGWLKLTVTLNMSSDAVEAAMAGGTFAGFRYATGADFCGMGLSFFGTGECDAFRHNYATLDHDTAKAYVLLFGPTVASIEGAAVRGVYEPRPGDELILGTHLSYSDTYGDAFSDTQGVTFPRPAFPYEGHYLVRAIPEPIGLGGLALVLAVLAGKRKGRYGTSA